MTGNQIFLSVAGVLVLGYVVYLVRCNLQNQEVKRSRSGLGFADFKSEFSGVDVAENTLRFVYEDLSDFAGYPVKRFDRLLLDLYMDSDDFESILVSRFGVPGYMQMVSRAKEKPPVVTVGDYVQFIGSHDPTEAEQRLE